MSSAVGSFNPNMYHVFNVFNQKFIVDKRFELIRGLGQGAYGVVCSAKCTETEEGEDKVAIKKVTNIFRKKILCKRALREIKLLAHFRGHKNIIFLCDLDIIPDMNGNFDEIFLYEELMECDLHQIIRSKQPLTDSHYQSFVYQILCGLKYIHSADVLHRDLKPGNLLVNADCELKICDFGLARGYSSDPEKNQGFLTEYVATRWYRAPEIILSFQGYTKAIDMWSVGCILAELLGGQTIFKGKDYVDQLNEILRILGTPDEETLNTIKSTRAQAYIRSLPYMEKVPFESLYPNAEPMAIDLLDKLLTLEPNNRITVDEALEHPYLEVWHDPLDEPSCPKKFDFQFEAVDELGAMRDMIVHEVRAFRDFVRRPYNGEEEIFDSSKFSYPQQNQVQIHDQNNQYVQQKQEMHQNFQNEQQEQYHQQQQQQQQQLQLQQQLQMQIQQQQMQQQQQQQHQQSAMPTLMTPTGSLQYPDQDIPPHPQEMIFGDSTGEDLEQELAYGLDGFSYQ